jgi:hypothetical protein
LEVSINAKEDALPPVNAVAVQAKEFNGTTSFFKSVRTKNSMQIRYKSRARFVTTRKINKSSHLLRD